MKDIIEISPNINVIQFSYGRNFHDRSVIASTIDEDGETKKHLYDLTGGIDILMDSNKNTVVVYNQE